MLQLQKKKKKKIWRKLKNPQLKLHLATWAFSRSFLDSSFCNQLLGKSLGHCQCWLSSFFRTNRNRFKLETNFLNYFVVFYIRKVSFKVKKLLIY